MKKKNENKQKSMTKIVATNVVASQPTELRLTAMLKLVQINSQWETYWLVCRHAKTRDPRKKGSWKLLNA